MTLLLKKFLLQIAWLLSAFQFCMHFSSPCFHMVSFYKFLLLFEIDLYILEITLTVSIKAKFASNLHKFFTMLPLKNMQHL